MLKFLAQTSDIWGEITPPSSSKALSEDPILGLGKLITFGINAFILVSGFALLIYLLWGAFEYITSGGESERINKARDKMVHAVIGIIVVFLALVIYGYVAGDMLGVIKRDPSTGQWIINIPRIE